MNVPGRQDSPHARTDGPARLSALLRGYRRAINVLDGLGRLAAGCYRRLAGLPATAMAAVSPSGSSSLAAVMVVRASEWIAITAITFRSVGSCLSLVVAGTYIGPAYAHTFLLAAVLLVVVNMLLLGALVHFGPARFLTSRWFCAVDFAVAGGVNLWQASALPRGVFLLNGTDTFWIYAIGTTALWTGLKGARGGGTMLAGFVVLLAGMVWVNGAAAGSVTAGFQIAGRLGWMASAYAVPLAIIGMSDRMSAAATAHARRAGETAAYFKAQVKAFRQLHDTVMQTLALISQRSSVIEPDSAAQFEAIERLADHQLAAIDEAVNQGNRQQAGLADQLHGLVREFARIGLQVELVAVELVADPPAEVCEAVAGAVREALSNALRHSQAEHAVIRAADTTTGIEVTVRDHGIGFDTAARSTGFGLANSITDRIQNIGGTAEISSTPGHGTSVRILAPLSNTAQDGGDRGDTIIRVNATEAVSVNALIQPALGWFVIATLCYRLTLTPIQAALTLSTLNPATSRHFVAVMGVVLAGDLALLIGLAIGRLRRLIRSRIFLLIDLSVAAALNIWAELELPHGQGFRPGVDPYWAYTFGVVAFWTAVRGPRTGFAIACGGIPVLAAMLAANHGKLDGSAWAQATFNQGWLFTTFFLAWLIERLATRGARQVVANALEVGRTIEATWALQDLYLVAAHVLEAIRDIARSPAESPEQRMRQIRQMRGLAIAERQRLDSAVNPAREQPRSLLHRLLREAADDLGRQGLRVELVAAELVAGPPAEVCEALAGAVREALGNTLRHSQAGHAVIRAADTPTGIEITVRDHGVGFDTAARPTGFGLANSITDRVLAVGGAVEVSSTPGHGTRVRLGWTNEEHALP